MTIHSFADAVGANRQRRICEKLVELIGVDKLPEFNRLTMFAGVSLPVEFHTAGADAQAAAEGTRDA